MEITQELLQTLHNRLVQVFLAKTNNTPDNIEMYEDGSFYCSRSWNISYGGIETISEVISAEDLTADLDELVKIRKINEEKKRLEDEKIHKEINARYEAEQKANRRIQYEKLKKEFEKQIK